MCPHIHLNIETYILAFFSYSCKTQHSLPHSIDLEVIVTPSKGREKIMNTRYMINCNKVNGLGTWGRRSRKTNKIMIGYQSSVTSKLGSVTFCESPEMLCLAP